MKTLSPPFDLGFPFQRLQLFFCISWVHRHNLPSVDRIFLFYNRGGKYRLRKTDLVCWSPQSSSCVFRLPYVILVDTYCSFFTVRLSTQGLFSLPFVLWTSALKLTYCFANRLLWFLAILTKDCLTEQKDGAVLSAEQEQKMSASFRSR